ncbi:hypothetical protein L2E82_40649 [Cichorium intybus]|uniref:Uncharacterized protein n=1 Tax=Cichorium intybus TaxID=13427 RepID=A0ACB9ALQ2_CICIN|nr:hypothetical protein L2E82_40649 [Cichorium intybus]
MVNSVLAFRDEIGKTRSRHRPFASTLIADSADREKLQGETLNRNDYLGTKNEEESCSDSSLHLYCSPTGNPT